MVPMAAVFYIPPGFPGVGCGFVDLVDDEKTGLLGFLGWKIISFGFWVDVSGKSMDLLRSYSSTCKFTTDMAGETVGMVPSVINSKEFLGGVIVGFLFLRSYSFTNDRNGALSTDSVVTRVSLNEDFQGVLTKAAICSFGSDVWISLSGIYVPSMEMGLESHVRVENCHICKFMLDVGIGHAHILFDSLSQRLFSEEVFAGSWSLMANSIYHETGSNGEDRLPQFVLSDEVFGTTGLYDSISNCGVNWKRTQVWGILSKVLLQNLAMLNGCWVSMGTSLFFYVHDVQVVQGYDDMPDHVFRFKPNWDDEIAFMFARVNAKWQNRWLLEVATLFEVKLVCDNDWVGFGIYGLEEINTTEKGTDLWEMFSTLLFDLDYSLLSMRGKEIVFGWLCVVLVWLCVQMMQGTSLLCLRNGYGLDVWDVNREGPFLEGKDLVGFVDAGTMKMDDMQRQGSAGRSSGHCQGFVHDLEGQGLRKGHVRVRPEQWRMRSGGCPGEVTHVENNFLS